jgi:uncharacterized protein DUF1330
VIDDDYMIVQSRISNEEQFGKYRQAVMPLIERFGGKHVRGGAVLATGRDDPQRARPGSGRCSAPASSQGPGIQTSRSSVAMTAYLPRANSLELVRAVVGRRIPLEDIADRR